MRFTLSMFYDIFCQKEYTITDYAVGNDDEISSFRLNAESVEAPGVLHISAISEFKVLLQSYSGGFTLLNMNIEDVQNLVDETFSFYRKWEEELIYCILENHDLQSLINIAHKVFKNPIYIANWQGKVLGFTPEYRDASIRPFWTEMVDTGILPISCIRELRESENYNAVTVKNKAILLNFSAYNYRCIMGMVNIENEILFNFQIIEYTAKLTPTTVKLANVFLSLLQHVRIEWCSEYALTTSQFFTELLEGKEITDRRLGWTLASLGWEQKVMPFYCLIFRPHHDLPSEFYLDGQLEHRIPGGKVICWNNEILAIINQAELEQVEKDICYTASSLGLRCGISLPFKDWQELKNAYKQAGLALDYATSDVVFSYCQQYIWKYTIAEIANQAHSLNLIHPSLYQIKEYDRKNHTELLKTLYVFLRNERNTTLTAKQLYVHRNTLQYRLHKINGFLGLDLDDPDNRFNLMASYALMDDGG